jgi:hypothetical protein
MKTMITLGDMAATSCGTGAQRVQTRPQLLAGKTELDQPRGHQLTVAPFGDRDRLVLDVASDDKGARLADLGLEPVAAGAAAIDAAGPF